MPDEPIRERVMAAIKEQLATIEAGTVVYATKAVEYWSSPSLVTRSLLAITDYDAPLTAGSAITQLDAGPVLGVVRASGSTFERIVHVDRSGPVSVGFEHQLRLTLWGYVKGTPAVLADTQLGRLWQDTVECLLLDSTLDGLVMDARPDGPMDTDDGGAEPLGAFAQDWLVVV